MPSSSRKEQIGISCSLNLQSSLRTFSKKPACDDVTEHARQRIGCSKGRGNGVQIAPKTSVTVLRWEYGRLNRLAPQAIQERDVTSAVSSMRERWCATSADGNDALASLRANAAVALGHRPSRGQPDRPPP